MNYGEKQWITCNSCFFAFMGEKANINEWCETSDI